MHNNKEELVSSEINIYSCTNSWSRGKDSEPSLLFISLKVGVHKNGKAKYILQIKASTQYYQKAIESGILRLRLISHLHVGLTMQLSDSILFVMLLLGES